MNKIKVERVVDRNYKTDEYHNEYYNIYHKILFKWCLDEGHLTHVQMLKYIERWLNFSGVKIITTAKKIK